MKSINVTIELEYELKKLKLFTILQKTSQSIEFKNILIYLIIDSLIDLLLQRNTYTLTNKFTLVYLVY